MTSKLISCMIFDEDVLNVLCSSLLCRALQLESALNYYGTQELEEDFNKTNAALKFYQKNLELLQCGDLNDK